MAEPRGSALHLTSKGYSFSSHAQPVTVALVLQPAMTVSGRAVFEGTTLSPPDPSRVRISLVGMEGTIAPICLSTLPRIGRRR